MRKRGSNVWVVASVFACLLGCTKSDDKQTPAPEVKATTPATTDAVDVAPDSQTKPGKQSEVGRSENPLAKLLANRELLDEKRERRLHPDRAEASTFLWNDWNRFQENYHPLYLVDDDPKTAWVEGAQGSGSGQWIRLTTSPVQAASDVRLRLRNGYHKSKSLFKKNARARSVTVKLIPSGSSKKFELPDSMNWQELVLSQQEGDLQAIEIEVDGVYEGSKYADLCLSDLEIFVTARTPENPAFERDKLAKVQAWKKERVQTAKWFASNEGKSSPLRGGYAVTSSVPDKWSGKDMALKVRKAAELIPAHKKTLERAASAYQGDFAGWRNVKVTPKTSRKAPDVDGLHVPDNYELAMEYTRERSFGFPYPGQLAFLKTSLLASFEVSKPVSKKVALTGRPGPCRNRERPHHFYWQPVTKTEGRAQISELLIVQCGQVAERDAYYHYGASQLLEYDDQGRLVAVIDDRAVETYEWSDDAANPQIVGGQRVRFSGNKRFLETLSLKAK